MTIKILEEGGGAWQASRCIHIKFRMVFENYIIQEIVLMLPDCFIEQMFNFVHCRGFVVLRFNV